MRKIIVIGFALFLAGCATFKNPVGKAQLDRVETLYGASYALLEGWRDQCAARTIPVSCRTQVPKAQFAATQAQGALVEARDLVDNYPNLDPTIALAKATSLASKFRNVLTQYGVK